MVYDSCNGAAFPQTCPVDKRRSKQAAYGRGGIMRVICAYCDEWIGDEKPEWDSQGKEQISHGCCKECYKIEKQKLDDLLAKMNKKPA